MLVAVYILAVLGFAVAIGVVVAYDKLPVAARRFGIGATSGLIIGAAALWFFTVFIPTQQAEKNRKIAEGLETLARYRDWEWVGAWEDLGINEFVALRSSGGRYVMIRTYDQMVFTDILRLDPRYPARYVDVFDSTNWYAVDSSGGLEYFFASRLLWEAKPSSYEAAP